MNNVFLDNLPTEWEGYSIDTDFRIGMQINQLIWDDEFSVREKNIAIVDLLFGKGEIPENAGECISWFLNGWCHDNHASKKNEQRAVDFDADQWRIHSLFLIQYGINLAEIEYLHWWEFMGLLTSAEDCAYKRVIDLRSKKVESGMSPKEKKQLMEAKEIYSLTSTLLESYTSEEKQKIEEYMRLKEKADNEKREREEIIKAFS